MVVELADSVIVPASLSWLLGDGLAERAETELLGVDPEPAVAPLDPHPATSARTTAMARTVTRFNIGLLVREGQRGLAWLATDTST
ncbi:MAG TPA: hypothetical protein VMU94_29125, partial [Streptosporangiaceae bacterium]|nr:hypothetical protein [Streptosporangiaceae bacterium]